MLKNCGYFTQILSEGVRKYALFLHKCSSKEEYLTVIDSKPHEIVVFLFFVPISVQKPSIKIQRLAEVRDVFIFCCYTGFAYIDTFNFERNAVMRGLDGEYWLKAHRQKTKVKESVPLLPIPLEIIERYRNHEYCVKYNKLLPINRNQRYNAYLKELADLCGIKKNLTTHIARHTFATTITLSNGVPIETVSSMLGHKNIKTTQIYAKVVEKKVSEDMKSLKEKFIGKESLNKTGS